MSGRDERLRAWAYLAAVAEPPSAPVIALAERLGPVDAAQAIRARRVPAGFDGVLGATEARAAAVDPGELLGICDGIGARLVTRDDDDWPGWQLLQLDTASTAVRGGGPLALWVRGRLTLSELTGPSIALVGTRDLTPYGEYVAGQFASACADQGVGVVSGGAFGIDGAAHRAALAAGGLTAAVLACGVDRDYPSGHARLFARIAEDGLIVSEYPPKSGVQKHRFLTRNRLVAALADAVVVVEAARRSGAANTAAWARRIGRPLGAVPGPINARQSVGCNRMIADGDAQLVSGADAMLALIAPDGTDLRGAAERRAVDDLTDEQRRTLDAIPGRGTVALDAIAFASGLTFGRVLAALAILEVRGLVATDGGTWRLVRS